MTQKIGQNAAFRIRQNIFRHTVITVAWLGILVPLVSLFIFSIRFPLTGVYNWAGWKRLIDFEHNSSTTMDLLLKGLTNSLIMAIITVAIMLVMLIPTMVWVRLKLPKLERTIEFIALLPLTIPAIALVVGLAPIYSFIATKVLDANSIWLAFAYVILVLPFSYRSIDAGLRAINLRTMVEAARSFGASWLTVILRIIVPNIRSAIISAIFVSIAVVLGEYTLASLLARTNLQTVLFQINLSDAQVSAAVSILLLVLTSGMLIVLDLVTNRQPSRKGK